MVMQINHLQNLAGVVSGGQDQNTLEQNEKAQYTIQPVDGKEQAEMQFQENPEKEENSYVEEYLKDRIHFPDTRERVALEVPPKNFEEAQNLVQVISREAVASVGATMNKLRAEKVAQLFTS